MSNNAELRAALPTVLPSLLLCDFGNLATEVRALEDAGARCLHLDVMDGSFVPNMTYGMPIVAAVRRVTQLPLDVHLMIANPSNYIAQFVDAGADSLTIHAEAVESPVEVLRQIRSHGVGAGLALNPRTPIERVISALSECDLVLAMSVEAGFGAQEFDPVALDKLLKLRELVSPDVLLEIDGGVNAQTIARCAAAGAQLLVVGSAIFRRKDASYTQSIAELSQLARCS